MAGPTKIQVKLAKKYGKRFHIKPSDLLDVIEHESSFQPGAVSSAGAFGLSQFIPSTAKAYGVEQGTSKHAQKTQVRGEAKYLHKLGWGGGSPQEIQHALAGYYGAASPYAGEVIASNKYAKYDKGGVGRIKGTGSTKPQKITSTVQTSPAVSQAAARTQAELDFIAEPNKDFQDYLSFTTQMQSLQDIPAQSKTVTQKVPGAKGTSGGKTLSVKGAPALQGGPKKRIVEVGKIAEKHGLSVGENPHFGGVAPVHVTGSYHYKARAIDVSGTTEQMKKFAHFVAKKYGPHITELFWQGPGGINIKNGDHVAQGYVTDHTDHVHVAI